eukprot:1333361-Amorphochlora_amoeboformis.AAC.1
MICENVFDTDDSLMSEQCYSKYSIPPKPGTITGERSKSVLYASWGFWQISTAQWSRMSLRALMPPMSSHVSSAEFHTIDISS